MTIIEALDLFSKIKGIEREKLFFSAEFEPIDEIIHDNITTPDTVRYMCARHYKNSGLGLKVKFFKDKNDGDIYYDPVFVFNIPNIKPLTNEIFKFMGINFSHYGYDPHPYLIINKFNTDKNRINAFIERVEFDPKEITTNYTSTKVENEIVK